RVKLWAAGEPTPLLALMVKLKLYGPAPRLGGVPLSTPVVLPIDSHGGCPLRLNVGAGSPVAVTWKLPAVPEVKVVVAALVMAGGARGVAGGGRARWRGWGSRGGRGPASRPADWTVALLSKMAWPSPPGGPGSPAAWASDGYSATNSMMYFVSPGFTVRVYA